MKIKRTRRGKGCRSGERPYQQRFIRFQRCGDLHPMAGAVLFQDDGLGAEFRADLRHGIGNSRGLE
jgi:glutathionylspermidine synthase